MICWGGVTNDHFVLKYFNDGYRYNPSSNTWSSMNTNGAPSPRAQATAMWTGTKMIIWGGSIGQQSEVLLNDGGCYAPTSDSWLPITTNGAPVGRSSYSAVWTGSEMIIWGGHSFNDGARYNPVTDSWSVLNNVGAPSARYLPTAVWTGGEMIIWGGWSISTGVRYNPVTDSWSPVSVAGQPDARFGHTAVWTGSEMIVFGGWGNPNSNTCFGDAYAYAPSRVMYLYLRP
jgi:N-acetylneuraminic acid mutarotase